MLRDYWRRVQHPAIFQGALDRNGYLRQSTPQNTRQGGYFSKRGYFEGWYYKLVDAQQRLAYAVIPGISVPAADEGHAFIQLLDGINCSSSYYRFPLSAFQAGSDAFWLQIGDHYFSDHAMRLALPELQADLQFYQGEATGPYPWPQSTFAPGVMGWYGFIPGMQCYHGLVSLHHQVRGHLKTPGGAYQINNGIGYIEKDWGSSFPNAWVWLQSNHLESMQAASLMLSVADIPWLGRSFVGFLCTFLFEGELHTMATWTGAKASVTFADSASGRLSDASIDPSKAGRNAGASAPQSASVHLRDRRRQLIVSGTSQGGGDLKSPLAGEMAGKINESLQTTLHLQFSLDGQIRYDGPAHWAGFEISDRAAELLAEM